MANSKFCVFPARLQLIFRGLLALRARTHHHRTHVLLAAPITVRISRSLLCRFLCGCDLTSRYFQPPAIACSRVIDFIQRFRGEQSIYCNTATFRFERCSFARSGAGLCTRLGITVPPMCEQGIFHRIFSLALRIAADFKVFRLPSKIFDCGSSGRDCRCRFADCRRIFGHCRCRTGTPPEGASSRFDQDISTLNVKTKTRRY